MKDISKIKKGITHGGSFHLDDIMSTAMLKMLNPEIQVVRENKYSGDGEDDEIVFDIGLGKFDHHGADRRLKEDGVPYSAFGLLFEEYGRELLSNYGFKDIEYGFSAFEEKYVSKVDYGDNFGYKEIEMPERDMVMSMNARWYDTENLGSEASNIQFEKAVVLGDIFLKMWLRDIFELVEYTKIQDEIWQSALDKAENGVIVLERNIPTKRKMEENPQLKMKITKDARSGGYAIYSNDEENYKIKPCEELTFAHQSGFMGVARTLQDALIVANRIVNEINCV